MRHRLLNRRASESFAFEVDGFRLPATVSHEVTGRVQDLFLNNHKAGNQAGHERARCRDCSDVRLAGRRRHHAIHKALCRDSRGRALGPLGAALDSLAEDGG